MDSSLLNSFHDDPFDGEYSDNTGFWSSSNESMRQLTETLNGILPIAASEVVKDIYDNTKFKDDFQLQNKEAAIAAASQLHTNNMLIYDHFTDQQITVGESVEIITIDPNEDCYGSEEDGEEEEEENDINGFGAYLDDSVQIPVEYVEFNDDDSDDDNNSQGSASTFRTRTDSSSIGDYESHSSDYDDDDEYMAENRIKSEHNESEGEVNLNSSLLEAHADESILFNAGFKLPLEAAEVGCKSRTNTYNSDIDGLGMNIDANNFDLADFITKDDFAVVAATATATTTATTVTAHMVPKTLTATSPSIAIPTKSMMPTKTTITPNTPITPLVEIINSKYDDSDCDSDVIVDVETVEIDAKEMVNNLRRAPVAGKVQPLEEAPYVDNIKDDPSWSPNRVTKKLDAITKETKLQQQQSTATALAISQQNVARNFSVVPSKKQCDFLKGKFGSGRKKNPRKERTTKVSSGKTKNTSQATGDDKIEKSKNKLPAGRIGLGQGGKNLALLKHEAQKYAEEQSASENDVLSPIKKIEPQSIQKPVSPKSLPSPIKLASVSSIKSATVKRKLNLEEYKQRRCGGEPIIKNVKIENNSTEKLEITSETPQQPPLTKVPPTTATARHSEAVTSIVKTLKEQQQMKQEQQLQLKPNVTDPITEAKNKVLRMQQLKKAQQLKIIDSKISAKVPRVTKLPSLREIVKDTYCAQQEEMPVNITTHPDYEEIITVSVRSNTDVSIPPVSALDAAALKHVKKVSRSLLKSSAVIYNTTTNNENVKISNQSLIASIQNVVVKKSLQPNCATVAAEEETTTEKGHHGEDKIIMHLRKDRIRNQCTVNIETQTDFQAAFPPLPLPPPSTATTSSNSSNKRERRNRNYRSSKRNSSEHSNDDAAAFESESDLTPPLARQRTSPVPSYRSRSRSRSADSCYSNANTIDRLRHSGDTTGGYSSRSSRRHRSSISSSYSESERISRQRQRKSSYKMRTKKYSRSSSTSSSSSDRSRTRSRSPHYRRSRSRSCSRRRSSAYNGNNNNYNNDRNVSKPAVEERRIVYVGRIEQETTKEMLRRKFLPYGNIKQITIHHKETGMKYGFVTYERSQDAFTVIDTSARDATINMYDISFGGRRAFCRSTYADLDNAGINTYHSYVFPKAAAPPKEEDSFEALLLKVKAKMSAHKPSPAPSANSANEI